MYLSFEANVNDKLIWRAFEDAALENLHLYDLKHTCQLQWVVTQHKPRFTSQRFNNMLYKIASDKLDSETVTTEDIHHILQGHRSKKSVDFYLKVKKILLNSKEQLFGQPQEGNEKQWADELVNVFYSFASNKPNKFGVY